MVFIDTSALLALADQKDKVYETAKQILEKLLSQDEIIVLHNYIIVEAAALIQRRLGFMEAETVLRDAANFFIVWIDRELHEEATDYFKKYGKRKLSFVDCMSFVVMKERGITKAFAFDEDFKKAGFELCA